MRKITILFTLFSSIVYAQLTEIDGAFGFKLGEKFDTARTDYSRDEGNAEGVINKITITSDVKPPFKIYRLTINPDTHVIATIMAMYKAKENCDDNLKIYSKAIESKYGLAPEQKNSLMVKGAVFYDGTRGVALRCQQEFDGYIFAIQYTDPELRKEAEDAAIARKASELDTSQL